MKRKDLCPFSGFNPCIELDCKFFIGVHGENPNTGENKTEWNCSLAMLPFFVMENTSVQRKQLQETADFRSETRDANTLSHQIMVANVNQSRLLEG